ncbi:hypothetical protein K431DRAFT_219650, partial [Polychaeton citri CBS 116435]
LLKDAGIEYVVTAGLAFDFCVKETAVDATNEEYTVFVVEEVFKAVYQTENLLALPRLELRNAGVKIVNIDC